MEITKLIVNTFTDDDMHYYRAQFIMNHCSIGINDLTQFPKDWEDMEKRKNGCAGGNSYTRWGYDDTKNTFTIYNQVSGSGGDSDVEFTFDTIKSKGYLELLFQAAKFDGTENAIEELITTDPPCIIKMKDDTFEFTIV